MDPFRVPRMAVALVAFFAILGPVDVSAQTGGTTIRIQALPPPPAVHVPSPPPGTTMVPGSSAVPATSTTGTQPSTAISKGPAELPDPVFAMTAQEKAQLESEAQQRKQQRTQKIQQATFDRRPSAILKAWATPREVLLDEGKKPEDNAQAAAASASIPAIRRRAIQVASGSRPTGANATNVENPAAKGDPFDRGLRAFQLDVTLGNWPAVKTFLALLPKDDGKALYAQLLQSLASGQAGGPGMMQPQQTMMNGQMVMMMPQQIAMEKNVFASRDILGLAAAAPGGLEKEALDPIGQVLRQSIDQGNAVEDFLAHAREELKKPASEAALSERQAAKLLFAANAPVEAGSFLPTPEKAVKDDDREALNLLARHDLALYDRDKKPAQLEQAWKVTQEALATGKVDRDQKDEAVRRAVELAPKVKEGLGRAWIEQSFTERPDRGMEILAAIGSATSQGLQGHAFDTEFRTKSIELQKLAVEALLKVAPERAKAWKDTLGLLAEGWLKEAEFSQKFDFATSLGPQMQFDPFGNMYYSNYNMTPEQMMARQGNMPRALLTGDVVKQRPSAAWLAAVDDGMRPRFATTLAQLYIKVNEEDKAFPFIESLAATHPRQAKELTEEFLKTWTKNHDPNSNQMQRSRFFYVYGFESRAEGIPLTRSKQERNLVELSSWVKKLKALPIGEIDEKLLTGAFTACHSPAEVYRLDAINTVFGSFDSLKPLTLAELIQQMRGNLIGVWRRPDEQEKQKTKRREKDIRGEILRGYEVATSVVDQGLKKYPDHWALVLAKAAILHDENNYRAEIEKSAEFVPRRQKAFAEFRRAATLYNAAAPGLPQNEETVEPYEMWFAAALGACDLQHITDSTIPDDRQPPLIRQTIETLPAEIRERHIGKFANALFTRLNVVKPSVKVRFLRGGFDIVGDHPQAHDARKVYDYYKDLVTEIKLEAKVDGPDAIGHDRPFGLFVNIRHTKEIERESGGFGRYLQNQNNSGYYYYNFGRPLENYRDKFTEMAKQALQEQFEVVSVTFQDEKVNSRSTNEYGWRITPYAYLLLKARGPKVDRIAPLRLDFDFMDTSGYVILPVESPAIPVDAGGDGSATRPHEKLSVTQILDERQAKDGKLIVEVKATARGLVPDLEKIVDLKPEGFELEKVDDQGLSVSKFDPDAEANVVDSERTWLVHFRGAPVADQPSKMFRFASAREEGTEMIHQRYVDADLAKVGPEVVLESKYGEPSRAWAWWLAGGLALAALAIGSLIAYLRNRPKKARATRFQVPEELTPFSVLGLLREIEHRNGLPERQLQELNGSIAQLERHYFAGTNGQAAEPDLKTIAETWVRRAS